MTDAQARQLLEELRWPNGPICPRCKQNEVTSVKGGREGLYNCRCCRRQFTVTVGTIFEGSHIKLSKWVQAYHLLCASKKGMSALQLSRMLGISYKSAWYMAHRIRYSMRPRHEGKLNSVVEVDETYVGGKPRKFVKKNRKERLTPVVALVERDGRARAMPTKSLSVEALLSAVQRHVDSNTKLMTDDWSAHDALDRVYDGRQTIRHSLGEYARDDVNTNTVESYFALLKRGIVGSYHHVSREHLGRYCDEFSFRWSHRKVSDEERTKIALAQTAGRRLSYEQVVG